MDKREVCQYTGLTEEMLERTIRLGMFPERAWNGWARRDVVHWAHTFCPLTELALEDD